MKRNNDLWVQVDEDGRLVLSPELMSRYGIKPGIRVYVDEGTSGLYLHRPTCLHKLYVEPTNRCNLDCRTCIRHSWNEPMGRMSDLVFDRVIDGLSAFSPRPTVFFGGFGEPLYHPKIVEMINRVKALGAPVELITNGTLLSPEMSQKLIRAGLDVLWVSLDGATPESYADVRLGAELPQVLENLAGFRNALNTEVVVSPCGPIPSLGTVLGIAFVAMKRNIADLPAVLKLAQEFGASHFLVTNVLPYTKEMCQEALYYWTQNEGTASVNPGLESIPRLSMPVMEAMDSTRDPLYWSMRYGKTMSWAGSDTASAQNHCPFIESGVGVIGWDGGFSPCLPLMHSYVSYTLERARYSRRWIIGNIVEKSLSDLWNDPEHIAFRERVQSFDFAPCASCGGCELADFNEEDCEGNTFPTCGGCLWAQGMIQCP